jgi:hypothetical protein
LWVANPLLSLVEVDFPPSIAAIGNDCDRNHILSGDPLAFSLAHIYRGVGNWLVV